MYCVVGVCGYGAVGSSYYYAVRLLHSFLHVVDAELENGVVYDFCHFLSESISAAGNPVIVAMVSLSIPCFRQLMAIVIDFLTSPSAMPSAPRPVSHPRSSVPAFVV